MPRSSKEDAKKSMTEIVKSKRRGPIRTDKKLNKRSVLSRKKMRSFLPLLTPMTSATCLQTSWMRIATMKTTTFFEEKNMVMLEEIW